MQRRVIWKWLEVVPQHRVVCTNHWRALSTAETKKRYPASHWQSAERCREFLDATAASNSIQGVEGWAKVSREDIKRAGGSGMLKQHGTLLRALQFAYPEREDEMTMFTSRSRVSRGYWAKEENQRAFLNKAARRFGVREAGDWEKVAVTDVMDLGGSGLIARYGSLAKTLKAVFPEMDTSGVREKKRWETQEARRSFFEAAAASFSVTSPEEWQRVKYMDLVHLGGRGLLLRYPTLTAALQDAYPEHKEALERRECRPRATKGYWEEERHVTAFIRQVATSLHLQDPTDFYRVSQEQICQLGGSRMLRTVTLLKALTLTYPDVRWNSSLLAGRAKRSSQLHLASCLNQLLLQEPQATAAAL